MAKAATDSSVTLKSLRLSESTYDMLAERAAKSGSSVEREIARSLDRYAQFNDVSPLHFTDHDRNELSVLVGKSFQTPADLIAWIKQMISAKVAGVDVPLHDQLIKRLQSRAFGSTWDELINRVVTQSLETHVGLR